MQENVFLAGMMKSGGIHISNCLAAVLGWRKSSLGSWNGTGRTEHDINPHVAWTLLEAGQYVFHMHTRGWPHNAQMLANFSVRPIILTRNVADVIRSVHDMLALDYQKELSPKMLPGVYVEKSYDRMSREEQELFLVQNLGPWLLSFYVSWKRQTEVPCLFVTYEEHFRDQVKSFRRMLDWLKLGKDVTDDTLARVSNTRCFNFNKGVPGRGRDLAPEAARVLVELAYSWGPDWMPVLLRELLSWTDGFEDPPTYSPRNQDSRTSRSWQDAWRTAEGSTASTTTTSGGRS